MGYYRRWGSKFWGHPSLEGEPCLCSDNFTVFSVGRTLEQRATRLVHKCKLLNNIYLVLFIKGRIVFLV